MYIVEIKNGDFLTEIHGVKTKLKSGKIVKGINSIDSFTFSMLPDNPGFNLINEFSTLVTAYNTNKDKYDFIGRVLYAETSMDESGFITKTVTCENVLGYLCDSWQSYVDEKNWTVAGLLEHLLDCHNSMVETDKQFKLGTVTAKDSNDNLYQAVQREKTWDAIKSKLIDKIGGELQVRVEEDGMYLDYLDQIGEKKQTEIALSSNMKAITREQDPTSFVTRLIPLGCKLKVTVEVEDEDGWKTEEKETEHRLDISSVNDGKTYIDDEQAISAYGIHVGVVEWDDVTEPANLKSKGEAWIKDNNKVHVKYAITALDLSLIGKVFDDFDVGNFYPIKNSLIAVDDVARVIKKSIDVCEEVKSTIEVGDSFKTLSDIQREQAALLKGVEYLASGLVSKNYELNKKIENTEKELLETFSSEIEQLASSISLEVSGSLGSEASIILSAGTNKYTGELSLSQVREAFANDETAISISAGIITFNSGTLVINSTNFYLDSVGNVEITGKIYATAGGRIGAEGKGWTIDNNSLYFGDDFSSATAFLCTGSNTYQTIAGYYSNGWVLKAGSNFGVTKAGKLYCADAYINGEITSTAAPYKTEIRNGSLRLYYEDTLCGTVNTKYYAGASRSGISLSIEDGGSYIMFMHQDSIDYRLVYEEEFEYEHNWHFGSTTTLHHFQSNAHFSGEVYLQMPTEMQMPYLSYASPLRAYTDSSKSDSVELVKYYDGQVILGNNSIETMIRGSTVYLKNTSTTVTSDRNAKNSIESLPDAYESVFDSIEPVRFKYNEGTSGRYHVGYIAQDVEAALTAAGLSTMDFAGFVDIGKSGNLGLMYDEFIALLHLKIKRLENRIAALENK